MTGGQTAHEPSARASLSGELADLLIDLSGAFQKHSMYPPGHPALAPALAKVVVRLSSLLSLRGDLVIAVARDQLIIEGVATDREHPLLRGLAERMYRHELGLMTLSAGLAERAYVLESGRLGYAGPMTGLMADESVRRALLAV